MVFRLPAIETLFFCWSSSFVLFSDNLFNKVHKGSQEGNDTTCVSVGTEQSGDSSE